MAVSRVIEVSFGRSSVALVRVNTAYFYNSGIIFKPTDIELPTSYQVHWADSPDKATTLETIGTAEGAPIPDNLWNRSRVIYGWIYLHPTEDSGITAYEVRIYKNVRAGLPDGTEPTPAEQSTIDQLIGALNSAVDQTGEDVESASQSAQSAESAKTAAESARDTAGEYANDAESSAASASTSASQASTSATASAQSASQSAQIKADVEGMVDDAQGYASASAQSASASANSASDAQGYAQSASASAQSASTSASNASTSAQTASTKASEANTSAQTASQKATESAQSASQALSYKTDAESAKTASQTAQGLAESARDTAVSAKTDAESARDDAVQAKEDAESAVASISGALDDKAPVITDTASGAIATFPDGADGIPLKSLIVDINPIQDLHGQENPYPAGGGKNLLSITAVTSTVNGVTFTVDEDGIITTSGTATEKIVYTISQAGAVTYKAGESYILNGCPTGGSSSSYWLSIAGAISVDYGNGGAVWTPQTDISNYNTRIDVVSGTNMDGKVFKPMVRLASETDATFAPYENICPISGWTSVDVEQRGKNLFDSNFSDYTKPYNYYICPIKLENGKRYKLKAELVGTTITGASFGLVKSGNRYEEFVGPYYVVGTNGDARDFNITVDDTFTAPKLIAYVSGENQFNEVLSNYNVMLMPYEQAGYEPYTGRSITVNLGQTVYGGKLDVLSGELTVYPYYASYNGETLTGEWISDRDKYVSGTTPTIGAQVVNIGAQGLTVQLEPHEVESLYGVNNLWADSGNTEVEYRADTKLFIERLTAPDSADMIADANITSGQYFMVGNSLYKATANIANGSAIVVGTNCIRKSLSEALNEINA